MLMVAFDFLNENGGAKKLTPASSRGMAGAQMSK